MNWLAPALSTLLRLKARGLWRKQWRRMKTPSGAIFTLLGLGMIGLWITSVVIGAMFSNHHRPAPETALLVGRVLALVLATMTISGSFANRGLFVPKEEIEPLFSGPLTRREVLRYRLVVNGSRSLIAWLFLSVTALQNAPNALFAFLSLGVLLQVLSVWGQGIALLAGSMEKRLHQKIARLPLVISVLLGAGVAALLLYGSVGKTQHSLNYLTDTGTLGAAGERGPDLMAWLGHPLVRSLCLPVEVFARAACAGAWLEFLPWFAASLLVLLLSWNLVERSRVDYRELSLETAASVAARIRRVRRSGGGASAGAAAKGSANWRAPWFFGRSPFGAITWIKTTSMLRKAPGTLATSAIVLVLLGFFSSQLGGESEHSELARPLLFMGMGIFYLGMALKFDFREELDRMEQIKTWPVHPALVFAGVLLPNVTLVSLVLAGGALVSALIVGDFHPLVLVAGLVLPVLVFAWVAVDNIAFLLMPVRTAVGGDSGFNIAGRALILLFLRMAFLGAVLGVVGLLCAAVFFLCQEVLGLSFAFSAAATSGLGVLLMLVIDALLLLVGGKALSRFDVSRDRG